MDMPIYKDFEEVVEATKNLLEHNGRETCPLYFSAEQVRLNTGFTVTKIAKCYISTTPVGCDCEGNYTLGFGNHILCSNLREIINLSKSKNIPLEEVCYEVLNKKRNLIKRNIENIQKYNQNKQQLLSEARV